ncbi:hypothetical protein NQ317_003103 [Molorchus minor]|uniref:Beta-galactosidase n=1 Tax=Molorchus minor TaxID=1323400 RepID=A0ABQ9JG10_9CUCU|nr:hypothetical protein NQ317_003103 [Molorchus minor]
MSLEVLPGLYEYYTGGGINSGLNADKPYFTLNDKNITIYSGALHYFRVPKPYWRDRLRKMRAAGLNAVETYVPWNLHEPLPGKFDFGQGGTDMEDFLDVAEFLNTAKEEDLLAIVRPGPYICSEWEFGGFPSWLLRKGDIKVRTSDTTYMKYVTRYFNMLLPILAALQFTSGGPIIAFQVENEYGSTEVPGKFTPDRVYLRQLVRLMKQNGITELLVSSDSPTMHRSAGTLPGVLLQTANFAGNPELEFFMLKLLQPGKPIMAMEFWTGWFDHWSEVHHTRDDDDFYDVYERILRYPASVNMYMFHGGYKFRPDTTSYDYNAPLTESGDYTIKYVMVKELLRKYNPVQTRVTPSTQTACTHILPYIAKSEWEGVLTGEGSTNLARSLPDAPHLIFKQAYEPQRVQWRLNLNEILENFSTKYLSPIVLPMEFLPINNMSGQSYGYIVYRKKYLDIPANSTLTIGGRICDSLVVLVNGKLVSKPLTNTSDLNDFGFWRLKDSNITLSSTGLTGATLDLLVENWGRNNFGLLEQFNQFKGLWQGPISLNNVEIRNWEISPLEFKKSWVGRLVRWRRPDSFTGPALYKTNFYVNQTRDTYLDMQDWCKGIVIVNNFVLGRYSKIGPQQSLYLPAPFLRIGWNNIVVFEHYIAADQIKFSNKMIYKTRNNKKRMY